MVTSGRMRSVNVASELPDCGEIAQVIDRPRIPLPRSSFRDQE